MKKTITKEFSVTVASGVGEEDTSDFKPTEYSGFIIKRIIITPTNETDVWSFYLEDSNSKKIYRAKNKTGTYIEGQEIVAEKGTLVLGFGDESTDGTYTVSMTFILNW